MLALAAKGEPTAVLKLIAAWTAVGNPTLAAQVAEGRALLALRLVDRAVARARAVIEAAPSDRAGLRLLAEAYIERGWPLRARPVLDGLRAAGEDVAALTERAAAEPPRPEATARETEATADFAARLALAEQFMAGGSLTRAAQLLERLAGEQPANPRVVALRWGLAGDFSASEPLELMVKRALPAILELSAVPEESEHTESLGADGNVLLEPEAAAAAPFPTLFKRVGPAPAPVPPAEPEAEEEEERTASSALPDPAAAPVALTSVSGGGSGDTQILMVVGEQEGGSLHRKREPGSGTLNLREWQASMGVDPVASDLDDVELSEELRTVGETPLVEAAEPAAPAPPPAPSEGFDKPIEVIERHPEPPPLPSIEPDEEVEEPEGPRIAPGVRVAIGGLFLFGSVLLLGLLALMIARATGVLDGARASVDLGQVLASSDYPALVEAEKRLAEHADAPAEQAELARARMVLWAEYDGDHQLLDAVDALLADPKGIDAHRLAYLRAAELLAFRNPASALAAIGREPAADDEDRLLLARIHAAMSDGAAAEADLGEIVAKDEPRYRLGHAQVLLTEGREPEARAIVTLLVSQAPNLVAARLLELQMREGTPQERAAAASVFRKTYGALGLSPRQEGEAAWVEARAWWEVGNRERAVSAAEAGVARDGTHRDLLMLLARDDVAQAELVASARKLQSLLEMYRADLEARQALVLVDLDLDRIAEARTAADTANPPLQGVLRALVYGWSGEAGAPDVAAVDSATPLGAWARALLAASAHRPDAAAMAVGAADLLAASDDPFVSRLAPRARVLAATLDPEPTAAAEVAELRRSGLADAAAHVFIGRYCERVGARVLAAQHFDRAAALEPELGLALYEKGRFYADAGDSLSRTQEAWQAYLALAPSGPRAERAKGAELPAPH